MAKRKSSAPARNSGSRAAKPPAPGKRIRATATPTIEPSERIFNCRPSKGAATDTPALAPTRATRGFLAASDYRHPSWPVGDQQKTGACVGWAVGNGLLRWYFMRQGLTSEAADLSVRYFWMAAKETDEFNRDPTTFLEMEGTSIRQALAIAERYGCLQTRHLPLSGALMMGSFAMFEQLAGQLRLKHPVRSVDQTRLGFAGWLGVHGPIVVRVNIDRSFHFLSSANPHLDTYDPFPNPEQFGHAVTVVGFIPESERFIIRNSWGDGWGERGFAYAHPDYLFGKSLGEPCAVTEAFGLQMQTSTA